MSHRALAFYSDGAASCAAHFRLCRRVEAGARLGERRVRVHERDGRLCAVRLEGGAHRRRARTSCPPARPHLARRQRTARQFDPGTQVLKPIVYARLVLLVSCDFAAEPMRSPFLYWFTSASVCSSRLSLREIIRPLRALPVV